MRFSFRSLVVPAATVLSTCATLVALSTVARRSAPDAPARSAPEFFNQCGDYSCVVETWSQLDTEASSCGGQDTFDVGWQDDNGTQTYQVYETTDCIPNIGSQLCQGLPVASCQNVTPAVADPSPPDPPVVDNCGNVSTQLYEALVTQSGSNPTPNNCDVSCFAASTYKTNSEPAGKEQLGQAYCDNF